MYMIITHMSLGLKFLLCLNEKYFDLKKKPFRYYGFSIAIETFFCDCGYRCFYHKDGYRQKLQCIYTL